MEANRREERRNRGGRRKGVQNKGGLREQGGGTEEETQRRVRRESTIERNERQTGGVDQEQHGVGERGEPEASRGKRPASELWG